MIPPSCLYACPQEARQRSGFHTSRRTHALKKIKIAQRPSFLLLCTKSVVPRSSYALWDGASSELGLGVSPVGPFLILKLLKSQTREIHI